MRLYRTAEILETAAEVIEERGWCQNVLVSDDGRFCAIGAINEASYRVWGLNALRFEASRQSILALDRQVQGFCHDWNDRPERSEFDVIDALKHAAKAERGRHE